MRSIFAKINTKVKYLAGLHIPKLETITFVALSFLGRILQNYKNTLVRDLSPDNIFQNFSFFLHP
jgi:hypothetical protein